MADLSPPLASTKQPYVATPHRSGDKSPSTDLELIGNESGPEAEVRQGQQVYVKTTAGPAKPGWPSSPRAAMMWSTYSENTHPLENHGENNRTPQKTTNWATHITMAGHG